MLKPYNLAIYILQLSQAKEFREGNSSLIRHVVSPKPLIHHIKKPFSRFSMDPEYNIPKYELESANAPRLLALNSNCNDKNLGTFLSSTERVALDEDLPCADPIRANYPYSMIHRLHSVPNALSTNCHSPKNMTWPSRERSHDPWRLLCCSSC